MADELRVYPATFPAGTPQSSPLTINVGFPPRELATLEIVVPPGPMGYMGFAITMGGVNVIPVQSGTYIVTDDETIHWPLSGMPNSGAWQVTGYNTDVFDHTVYLRFLVNLLQAGQSSMSPTPALLSALSNL